MNINEKEDVQYLLEHQSEIEEKIGYRFGNYKKLLIQAFTRKSFAVENEEYKSNEELEFYGDQLVNTIMTDWLWHSYSTFPNSYKDDFFYSEKNESELTRIRAKYVNRSALAHCIDVLNLDRYLLLGKSDKNNEVWKNEKVRCDLFEAIIGAIAVASSIKYSYSSSKNEWNWDVIEKSCKLMWEILDFDENFIDMLYDKCDELDIREPKFSSIYKNYDGSFKCNVSLYLNDSWYPTSIDGFGKTETAAKMDVSKRALDYLQGYQIRQIIGNATEKTAVQALNTLYLKKFISKPNLNCFIKSHDDGHQLWRCECFIDEYKDIDGYMQAGIGEAYSKAEAKRLAALDMIEFIHKNET